MRKIIILVLLLFISNYSHGQFVKNESRKLLSLSLNAPSKIRNGIEAYEKIALQKKIKRIQCFKDSKLESDLYFDRKGNGIKKIDFNKGNVSKSIFEHDSIGRTVKTAHFFNDKLKNGSIIKYDDYSTFLYRIEDGTLWNKKTILKDERIEIYTSYDASGKESSKSIYFKKENEQVHKILSYHQGDLYQEVVYFTKDGEEYVDNIQYSENGQRKIKTSKRRAKRVYDKWRNVTSHHVDDFLVFKKKYNESNRLLLSDFYSRAQGLYRSDIYTYEKEKILLTKKQKFFTEEKTVDYEFYYNTRGLLKKVTKINGDLLETFTYTYEYY
ncbi:hypothetical protein [Pseudotenacibaculum haliotis]|uniref:Sugar-binding protein n=1 Tax=Pseudotenacibaculum haliotis TaxID=1862138 RepID=A0ABW5LPJ1_9FLAO